MTPKKLDDEIVRSGQKFTAPHDVKIIEKDEVIYIPGSTLTSLLQRLQPYGSSSGMTKKDLLERTKNSVKRQLENNTATLIPFDQVEYRKMLEELDEHCDNKEGWTRDAWEWQMDRIIANYLDRTGLTSPEKYPFGRILDENGEVKMFKPYNRENVIHKRPSITIHDQKGDPYNKYRYARNNSMKKKDGLLW